MNGNTVYGQYKSMYQDMYDTKNEIYKVIKPRTYFNLFQFIFFLIKSKKMSRDSQLKITFL